MSKSDGEYNIKYFSIFLLMSLWLPAALATPDEASGAVTRVIDGDTFEVQGFDIPALVKVVLVEEAYDGRGFGPK
jgi:hypothetical protein